MIKSVMDPLAGERDLGSNAYSTSGGYSGDILRSPVCHKSSGLCIDFYGACLDGVDPGRAIGIHETAGEDAIHVVGVSSGGSAVAGANDICAMSDVRATADFVDRAEGCGECGGVCETVYLLCAITDRLMSVGEVTGIQMHEP